MNFPLIIPKFQLSNLVHVRHYKKNEKKEFQAACEKNIRMLGEFLYNVLILKKYDDMKLSKKIDTRRKEFTELSFSFKQLIKGLLT